MPQLSSQALAARLLHLLRHGLSPDKLALSVALGVGVSCFPIFGTTTILCTVIALAFRLSLPAIQVGNYLALPLQLVLFVPFLRLGERVLRAPKMPLLPGQLVAMAKNDPTNAMRVLLAAQWHSIVGWLIVAPAITLLLALALRPLMRLLIARTGASPAKVTILR